VILAQRFDPGSSLENTDEDERDDNSNGDISSLTEQSFAFHFSFTMGNFLCRFNFSGAQGQFYMDL
jgi:hypothetical protein